MRVRSLRTKIAILVVSLVTASILMASAVHYQLALRSLKEDVRERAASLAAQIAFGISTSQELVDHALLTLEIRNILAARPALRWLDIYAGEPSGLRMVASTREPGPSPPELATRAFMEGRALTAAGTARGGEAWLAAAPILIGNTRAGVVALALSLEGAQRLAVTLRQQLLIILFVAGVTISVSLALFMDRNLNRPINALLDTMAAVEKGDLLASPGMRRGDEMGRLADGLTNMLDRIRESHHENAQLLERISHFNQDLQFRVAEATRELGERNQALQRANERLFDLQRQLGRTERLASLGQLTATIAHEIGTPLNAVAVHLQLLARSPGLTHQDRKRLVTIEAQILRLVKTVQEFLAATRDDARPWEPANLNQLLRSITDLMAPALDSKRIVCRFALDGALPSIRADSHRMQQVILNLLTNAMDAMPSGGSLQIDTGVSQGFVFLRIADSGPGIPPEAHGQIFEPFFTTKASGAGAGLGLAVCRRVVEAHHGTIAVTETPGGGATFEIRLPFAVSGVEA